MTSLRTDACAAKGQGRQVLPEGVAPFHIDTSSTARGAGPGPGHLLGRFVHVSEARVVEHLREGARLGKPIGVRRTGRGGRYLDILPEHPHDTGLPGILVDGSLGNEGDLARWS